MHGMPLDYPDRLQSPSCSAVRQHLRKEPSHCQILQNNSPGRPVPVGNISPAARRPVLLWDLTVKLVG
jgi:hypothetical protein